MADPNHVVVDADQVIFVLPHKNACTSMKEAIREAQGLPANSESTHILPCPLRYEWPDRVPPSYRVVGAIRDPWARTLSGWRWHCDHGWSEHVDADAFLMYLASVPDDRRDVHVRSQAHDFYRRLPDRWICVETLDMDWLACCEWLNWPATPMPHLNRYQSDLDVAMLVPYQHQLLAHFADDVRLYAQAQRNRAIQM